jgi:hypothetical protein
LLRSFLQNDYDPGYGTVKEKGGILVLTMEVSMSFLAEYIVYIWLLPLALYIVLPLSMLAVYLIGRLIHFMLFPKRLQVDEEIPLMPESRLEKIS